jgi:hypothetical protein
MTDPAAQPTGSYATRALAERLRDLAERLARLAPSRHDPERFHIDKSDLVDALRRLARDHDRHDAQREQLQEARAR